MDKDVTFSSEAAVVVVSSDTGSVFLWFLTLGDTLKLSSLWVLSMLRRVHSWFPGEGCVWLGSRLSDSKKLISLAGMLSDMLWCAVVPLVYCGCISVDPQYSLVCYPGLDNEEGIAIIHLLGPDSFQWLYPCFYLLLLCSCQRWIYIHRHIIFQLIWDWSGGWEIFLHVFLGLIIFCGIWDWCVDAIVDELGSFMLIGFPYGSLVWNIFIRASR